MQNILLCSEGLEAKIALKGAELKELRHVRCGQLMWPGDPASWPKTSPLLFPVIGRVRDDQISINGQVFPMPQHGFAQNCSFNIERQTDASCLLAITDTSETRLHYPFPFCLEVSYSLEGGRLQIEATVTNASVGLMPASFGFHPGFRWPLETGFDKRDHVLRFAQVERLIVARPVNTLLGSERTVIELSDGTLPLDEKMFERGALILLALRNRQTRFEAVNGSLAIDLAFDGLANLGLWMRPGADFFCIEPWQGHADPHDFTGDFFEKPGLDLIQSGGSRTYRMTISVID
jgi:galactose mutarotase-like enzyme